MKEIKLTQNKSALVDDEDYDDLIKHNWHANKLGNTFYAKRCEWNGGKNDSVLMHREILSVPKCLETDHIDGNGLNNQKSNLRIVTKRENAQNLHYEKSSKYPGVCKCGNKWMARIQINGERIHLGMFVTEKEAHKRYMDVANSIKTLIKWW